MRISAFCSDTVISPKNVAGFAKQSSRGSWISPKCMSRKASTSSRSDRQYRLTLNSPGGKSICSPLKCERKTHFRASVAGGGERQNISVNEDFEEESFFLFLLKDLWSDIKWMLLFIAEQPNQLKHIEWPSLQNTLKTATLTLILVVIFIIFLSSVDSGLRYLLESTLRRPG